MSAPKVSIIIPVYNAQKVLRQCIDSCLGQSFREIEVILVNDASTDNSLSLCKEYSKRDERVVVIDEPVNEGVEKVRFKGLRKARGKYVMFIDDDDWLCDDVLSQMYEKAEETGADYVEVGSNRVFDGRGWIKKAAISHVIGEIRQPELFDKYFISFFGYNILSVNIWGKLYRRTTIEEARLAPVGLIWSDDLAFNMQLFPYLKSIYILDTVGYNYRWGGG